MSLAQVLNNRRQILLRMIAHLLSILMALYGNHSSELDQAALTYIEYHKEIAIMEMHRSGVPASITLAQALVETNAGRSDLAVRANNHFGIKCKRNWNGQTYYHKDDDRNDKGQLIESCFRSYDSVVDSYADHSNFLKNSENYIALFLLDRNDYVNWAYGLKKGGYATDPSYSIKLINKIESYQLDQYDAAVNPMTKFKRQSN